MHDFDDNPGGSFKGNRKKLSDYIREYKRLGNHVKRYQFAKSFVTGKEVIDFGCGYGAGAILLAPYVQRYIGIDIDKDAISYAKNNIEKVCSNTQFFEFNDFINLRPAVKADAVICFEVIEHVKDPNTLISILKGMTKSNGTILISTPNGLSSKGNKAYFRSKFHFYEYSPIELYNLLRSQGIVSYYGEKRIDSMDVRWLINRFKYVKEDKNDDNNSHVPLDRSLLFNLANRFFNGAFFWKIQQIEPLRENELNYSTLIAVLKLGYEI